MTVKGGTSQACAACKYQRRKCNTDCPLAPYFPPDQPKQFQNAHRLFGVSNILKILKHLDTSQKMEAMRSIVYQANIREKYPVHGCRGFICSLQVVIHQTQQELAAVNAQLAICREQHHQISSPPPPPPPPSSQLQLAPASVNNSLTLFQNHYQNQPFNAVDATEVSIAAHHHFLNNFKTESSNSNHNISNFDQVLPQYSYPHSYNNSMVGQSQFIPAQPLTCQQQATVATHGFDEMSTFLDGIEDDRQSSVESKESSSESSVEGHNAADGARCRELSQKLARITSPSQCELMHIPTGLNFW